MASTRAGDLDRADAIEGSQSAEDIPGRASGPSRRKLLRQMAGMSLALPLGRAGALPFLPQEGGESQEDQRVLAPAPLPQPGSLTAQDEHS